MWHEDLLLGNDHEINNYTKAITRWQPINSNSGTVLSVQSVPRCYKQDELVGELVSQLHNHWDSVVGSCCCEKLVAGAKDSLGTQRKGNVWR
jgi:hypothetical protein